MAISFADIPLLLEDPEGQVQDWLEKNLSIDDLRMFGVEPTARTCTRNQPRSSALSHVGLPLHNWPTPPRPKINTLWWPCTGASRWAIGYFFADTDTINKIYDATDENNKGTLVLSVTLGDGTKQTVSGEMYSLAPRKLSSMNTNGLWLLPLVDQRYFWQFRDVWQLKVKFEDKSDKDTWTTWSDVIGAITTELGISVTYSEPSSAYQYPDPVELTRQYENIAVLLDAVAECVGCRVVAYGENISLMNASDSADALTTNFANENNKPLAGGESPDLEGLLPEQVQVVFPKVVNWFFDKDGEVYVVEKAGSYYTDGTNMPTGTSKTFFDAAGANYLAKDDAAPDNASDLDALADQIATDYYGWLKHVYDATCIGLVQDWTANGFDDYVWYHIGYQYPPRAQVKGEGDVEGEQCSPGNYACFTRVCSLPYNFGVVDLLHQTGPVTDTTTATHYVLITDLDEDRIVALANPLKWDDANMQWVPFPEQMTTDETPEHIIDPAWTVAIFDTARAAGAWQEDIVLAQPLDTTVELPYIPTGESEAINGTFQALEITGRISQQTTYVAYIPPGTIAQGQFLPADSGSFIIINGLQKYRAISDMGTISGGQAIFSPSPDGMYVGVIYFTSPFPGRWCFAHVQCDKTEYL